jgi:hypothetical protein
LANAGERLFSRNQPGLARFNLIDSSTDLSNLSRCDSRFDIVRNSLDDSINQIGALCSRKLFRLCQNVSNGLSHPINIPIERNLNKTCSSKAAET